MSAEALGQASHSPSVATTARQPMGHANRQLRIPAGLSLLQGARSREHPWPHRTTAYQLALACELLQQHLLPVSSCCDAALALRPQLMLSTCGYNQFVSSMRNQQDLSSSGELRSRSNSAQINQLREVETNPPENISMK